MNKIIVYVDAGFIYLVPENRVGDIYSNIFDNIEFIYNTDAIIKSNILNIYGISIDFHILFVFMYIYNPIRIKIIYSSIRSPGESPLCIG